MDRLQGSGRLVVGVVLIALAAVVLASIAIAGNGKGKGAAAAQYEYGPAGKAYGHNKVVVCHKGKTKRVPPPAVKGHMKHGDTLGACA